MRDDPGMGDSFQRGANEELLEAYWAGVGGNSCFRL